ncbi:UNVERIFIED_ORG: class F sortase [Bacillus sp. AZ43]
MFADAALATVPDDLSAPPPGSARVRVLSAAAGPVDVGVVGGDAPAERLAPGDVGAAGTVPAGTLTLAVGAAEVPVTVAAGTVVTLLVLDRPGGGLEVRTVLDAAGPGVVPTGAVEAGSGPGLVPAAGAVLAGLVVARRRARVLLTVAGLTATALLTAPGPASAEGAVTSPHAAALPAAPVRLVVPSVGVNAPLTGVGLDPSGAFAPPADPAVAGWYTGGPAPGAIGPAAIAGHVDWAGAPGVFAALARVEPGAAVVVARADGGTARFTVTRVVRTPKTSFPTAEVYAPVEGAELRLITCGGAFDRARGSYEDNVVVFAEGASS